MKKLTLIALLVLSVFMTGLISAETMIISSDNTMQWSANGINWNPALVTWAHPAWPTISGASWIWRTAQTNSLEEYTSVPEGGWYFKQTFEIPKCIDEKTLTGTVTAAADNAYEMYFNGVYVDGRGIMNKEGPDALSWQLKTTSDLTNLHTGTNEISFRALNYFDTGDYSSNPAGLIFQIQVQLPEDEDKDNICYEDMCIGTKADEPEEGLGTNRWIWNGTAFVTKLPKGKGPQKSYSIEDTHGCSCKQILTWLHDTYPEEYGAMEGHWKYGCSSSVMDDFVELTA